MLLWRIELARAGVFLRHRCGRYACVALAYPRPALKANIINKMATFNDLYKFFDRLDQNFLQVVVPRIIAEKATEFYKQRFTVKADVNNRPWPPARHPPTRGSLLVRSGNLMASVRPSRVTPQRVVISAGSQQVPYAAVHNEGATLTVPVTRDMRKFAWAMKYKTGDDRWKGLALTKKRYLRINIPKRQFMGHSIVLRKLLIDSIRAAYSNFIKH